MSSSITLEHKAAPQNLADPRRSAPNEHGVGWLAQRIALHVESLVPQGRARCLDVGCGDMALAEAIHEQVPRTDWRCIDVHQPPPAARRDPRWSKYRAFDGRTMPYGDGEFDIALLCDVLHHASEDAARLLGEASRVARRVLVKDRFVGHSGYGADVPQRCFTREAFVRLAAEQRLVITALDCGLSLHEQLPVARAVVGPDRQFIAVLGRG
jgi:SAM-dependent methyltransferase